MKSWFLATLIFGLALLTIPYPATVKADAFGFYRALDRRLKAQ